MFIVRAASFSRRSPAQGGRIAGEMSPGRARERAPGRRRMLKAGTEIGREQQGHPCYSAGQEGDVWGRERRDCWAFAAGSTLLFCPPAVPVFYPVMVSCKNLWMVLRVGAGSRAPFQEANSHCQIRDLKFINCAFRAWGGSFCLWRADSRERTVTLCSQRFYNLPLFFPLGLLQETGVRKMVL